VRPNPFGEIPLEGAPLEMRQLRSSPVVDAQAFRHTRPHMAKSSATRPVMASCSLGPAERVGLSFRRLPARMRRSGVAGSATDPHARAPPAMTVVGMSVRMSVRVSVIGVIPIRRPRDVTHRVAVTIGSPGPARTAAVSGKRHAGPPVEKVWKRQSLNRRRSRHADQRECGSSQNLSHEHSFLNLARRLDRLPLSILFFLNAA